MAALDSGRFIPWLCGALGLSEGESPFPWQERLLREFLAGNIPSALDIPTGLGKTAVMAIWLVARALGASLPRRLVYVVDRRAVVDQATEVASKLQAFVDTTLEVKKGLGLEIDRSLPISTLRGQYVDNRDWLEDPASPAIIVGTVDMIGSRLLFQGYGVSRKMRPYHAGLLGADTLVVLDEAHLVPPFEKLLMAIAKGTDQFGPKDQELKSIIPPFRLITLSATGRHSSPEPFGLSNDDLQHPVVNKRLFAKKLLTVMPLPEDSGKGDLPNELARQAWALSDNGTKPIRCVIFCDRRKDAQEAAEAIKTLANGSKKAKASKAHVELFVGGRRVFERIAAAKSLTDLGFIPRPVVQSAGDGQMLVEPNAAHSPGKDLESRTGQPASDSTLAFLVATSAGEVGVDLDADHMVCDLVPWERMVQRLGRVNRRGGEDRKAHVIVVPGPEPKEVKAAKNEGPVPETVRSWLKPLEQLPKVDGHFDASPGAIRARKLQASPGTPLADQLNRATTPPPLFPALSPPLVEAWSMTSLQEHPGRPVVDPWLRGWREEDGPQTAVIWRKYLPVRLRGERASQKEIEAFFEDAPPHTSEILETETWRVLEWLEARASALSGQVSAGEEKLRASAGNGGITDSDSEEPEESDGSFAFEEEGPDQSDTDGEDSTETADAKPEARSGLKQGNLFAFILGPAGEMKTALQLRDAIPLKDKKADKRRRSKLEWVLPGATIVVDARFGGLAKSGLIDAKEGGFPQTADGEKWLGEGALGFRVRDVEEKDRLQTNPYWREVHQFSIEMSEDGDPLRWLVVEKWQGGSAEKKEPPSNFIQRLDRHHRKCELRARSLAKRLGFPAELEELLAFAASLHDQGKAASRWQRAFGAPLEGGPYAKTERLVHRALLEGYRHELGSLFAAEQDPRLKRLPPGLQDLALHLITAHHGNARPLIELGGCEAAPPSVLRKGAAEMALRFATLQGLWGPWGLAWWEALLRAADQQSSRESDAVDPAGRSEEE